MFVKSIAFGVSGWLFGAQFVKYTGMAEPATKWSNLSLYLVGAPVGASFLVIAKLMGIKAKDCFEFISIATAAALVLDGIASNLFPVLYTHEESTPVEALGVIAYAGGVGILAGYAVSKSGSYGF